MSRPTRIGLVAFGVTLLVSPSRAWNTETDETWKGVYWPTTGAELLPDAGFLRNEHAELTHMVLSELGLDCLALETPVSGACGMQIVDLNASLFRRGPPNDTHGDRATTALEERHLPPPAHFAGLPDFGWAIYDWINKSRLCPARDEDALYLLDCHAFVGWMGLYNANHFGTQARHMYTRYHTIAMRLAGRAKALRELLEGGPDPIEADAYTLYVREAELEALTYEGFAQHFLQDRWSSGHMWERWNGADEHTTLGLALDAEVAAASGLLHGSQGITKVPEPMCSPVPDPIGGRAVPVTWRHVSTQADPIPGVGDYRLEDMHDGTFGPFFGFSLPLNVTTQRAEMVACSKAGWVAVVRAFGANARGGFGAHGFELDPALSDDVLAGRCWDMWATNASVRTGWASDPLVVTASNLGRMALGLGGTFGDAVVDRTSWIETTWTVRTRALADPDGTDLARGGVDLGFARPGNRYAFDASGRPRLPAYAEPEDLLTLPLQDPAGRGRELQAIVGFFNRAHTDWWCDDIERHLSGLRASDDVGIEACTLLAERVVKGTDPSYKGRRTLDRTFGGRSIEPICARFGVTTEGVDDDLPYRVHPGYVPAWRGVGGAAEAWCRDVPIVDGHADITTESTCAAAPSETSDPDVVAIAASSVREVPLRGRGFGPRAGEVLASPDETGPFETAVRVARWGDDEIVLDLSRSALAPGDWYLQIVPADDPERASVGLFILRVLPGPPAAPFVTELTFGQALVPGADVDLEVIVADPETSADLTAGGETVAVDSAMFEGGAAPPIVGATGAVGACGASFDGSATLLLRLNDRSNCDPPTHEVGAVATDSPFFPDGVAGPAVTGPRWVGAFEVDNVAPEVPSGFQPADVRVAPGESLALEVEVQDDNNDHASECEELPAERVELRGGPPSGLDTDPELDRDLDFVKLATDVATGVSRFRAVAIVEAPHEDNDPAPPDCPGAGAPPSPFVIGWTARDDAGLGLTSNPELRVVVTNVAPVVTRVSLTPRALHPGVATEVTIDVVVDDANFAREVEEVAVNASGCAAGLLMVQLERVAGTEDRWSGVVTLEAMQACPLVVTAVDDDCAASAPWTETVAVQNFAPVFTGHIAGWDGTASECTAVLNSVGFSDANGDALSVVAHIEGPGGPWDVPLARDPASGHYVGTFEAPCAGRYTVTYIATEIDLPAGVTPLVTVSPPWVLDVVAGPPEACPPCHGAPACEPIVAERHGDMTQYTVACESPIGKDLSYRWWTPTCGALLSELPFLVLWDHAACAAGGATELVSVEVGDGAWQVRCTYPGVEDGEGPACDAPSPSP